LRREPLAGILTIGVAVALVGAVIGFVVFDLPFWAALLLYSVSGTLVTLVVAWRRFRCVERRQAQAGAAQ